MPTVPLRCLRPYSPWLRDTLFHRSPLSRLFAKVLGRLVHPPACDRGTGQLHGNLGIRPGHQTFADEGSLLGVAFVQDPRHLAALGQRLGFDPFCTDGVLSKGYRPEPLLEVPSAIRRGVGSNMLLQ